MSRVASFIRRMQAQRDCINWAGAVLRGVPGPVAELGLGNGRSYSHMVEVFADRDVYAFDRKIGAHPSCIPPERLQVLGDARETVPGLARRIGRVMPLVHSDLGDVIKDQNDALAREIGPMLETLVVSGGLVISGHEMPIQGWAPQPLPDGIAPGRYFIYRLP